MKSASAIQHATAASAPHAVPASVFQRLVVGSLKPLRKGRLTLELPDHSTVHFGEGADGAALGLPPGVASEARIIVRDERFFRRCVLSGDVGFGESYVAGEWNSPDVVAVIAWFLLNIDHAPTLSGSARRRVHGWTLNLMHFVNRAGYLMRRNTRKTVRRNIREHYDVSNSFFERMLDPSMMYSCALWEGAGDTLAQAQERKNESLCRLLRLKPSDHVLEIGTGWGGWSLHAASRYGSRVTTLTISEQQFNLARERIAQAGLADRIDVQLADFREWHGTYDKIVSIEMMEALGHAYVPEFCRFIDRSLERDGLVALQFITCPDSRYAQFRRGVDFIQKHVFPGSLLLSLNRVNDLLASAGGFVLNHVSDHGANYARTLREWRRNLHDRRAEIEGLGFDDTFFRGWHYYLAYCEAAFAMRNISVVQTLHTRPNNLSLG
jgi:cyclopropane-fatty-acyl-phospholipid synthase